MNLTDFQQKVSDWLNRCFGHSEGSDLHRRRARFIEEAIELAQAVGANRETIHAMVNRVYDRPLGEVQDEFGGVLISVSALASSLDLGLEELASSALSSVETRIEDIRKRNLLKPHADVLASDYQSNVQMLQAAVLKLRQTGHVYVRGEWLKPADSEYKSHLVSRDSICLLQPASRGLPNDH